MELLSSQKVQIMPLVIYVCPIGGVAIHTITRRHTHTHTHTHIHTHTHMHTLIYAYTYAQE